MHNDGHSFSCEDRELLRDSVRGQLSRSWPVEQAVEHSKQPAQVRAAWRELCDHGFGALGADPAMGGWREALLVIEELGRGACPAPMLETVLANKMLAAHPGDAAADLLSRVHSGETLLAMALGSYDGDPNAGQVDFAAGRLSGAVAFVEGLEPATHVLAALEGAHGIAIVPTDTAGMRAQATPGLGAPLFHAVSFERTPALALPVARETIQDCARLARLGMLARSLGRARDPSRLRCHRLFRGTRGAAALPAPVCGPGALRWRTRRARGTGYAPVARAGRADAGLRAGHQGEHLSRRGSRLARRSLGSRGARTRTVPAARGEPASEIIGPALIAYGTPGQKERFLPAFLRGELTFSLGYSESEAGSDLATLRTSASREGDEWVINGEKLWTSRGDVAHYHWLAARSDPHASPKHAGITMFMVPLDTPGITIRHSMAMYGHTFSAVHYDNVRVPDGARVGAVNGGWKVIAHALASERIVMGSYVAAIRSLFDALVRHAATASEHGRALRDDPVLRDRLGGLAAEIEAARHLAVNGVMVGERGRVPVYEAAMSKVYSGELLQRVTQAAIDLLGPVAIVGEESTAAVAQGRNEQLLRRSIMMVLGGGTAEVQRTLIAQRGPGLPR